jgi:membrane-bound lytic murein transglycosylase F
VTLVRPSLAALAFLLLGTCEFRPSTLAQVQELGELRIATRNSPLAYYLGAEGPEGPEYELAARYAESLGVRALFIPCDSAGAVLQAVKSGRAHVGAAALPITAEARRDVGFAKPYQQLPLHVVYEKDQPRPDGVSGLTDRRVGVPEGSAHAAALRAALGRTLPVPWEIGKADALDLLDRVSYGELEVTVADSNEFATARRYHPELRVAFNLPSRQELAWALPRGDAAWARSVNEFFAGQRDFVATLIERYYVDEEALGEYTGTRNFLRHVAERLPKYRGFFEQVAAQLGADWRIFAAVGYQESKWDPNAVSPTGVRGLMMLQTDTAAALGVHDRADPKQSIFGGARYLQSVRDMIPERVPEPDRTWFALAAYNVGYGHLEDARVLTQSQGKNPDSWQDVRAALPLLAEERYYLTTKRGYARGWEAVRFVDNVRTYIDLLDLVIPDPSTGEAQVPNPQQLAGIRPG